jgi:hypothetical protein
VSGNVADRTSGQACLSISTQSLAQNALEGLNAAIVSKDKIRANLGALQNRLQNTITNLQIQAENLQAAESQISDVDVATEMTQFVRNQILTQSAVAMLAQANSLPQDGHAAPSARVVLSNLEGWGYQGRIVPVNWTAQMDSCALDDLAGIDLAVVCLAPEFVLEALERIADMGVKAVIITSAGFREIGGQGYYLEESIIQLAARRN